MSADLLPRLWLLASLYPGLAFVLIIIVCLLGTLVALAIVSMSRPELALHQWQDDDDQHRAVTRPAPLPWGRAGGKL